MARLALVVVVLAAVVLGVQATLGRKVLYTRHDVPQDWQRQTLAHPSSPVRFIIALTQRNLQVLEKEFWERSTPGKPNYRKWMTTEEVVGIVAPPQTHVDRVLQWLAASGVKDIKNFGDALEVRTSVGTASAMFSTEFHVYANTKTKKNVILAWGQTSIPQSVAPYVDFVEGINNFPMKHLRVHHANLQQNNYVNVPQTLQALYSIPSVKNGSAPKSSIGVIEFEGESYMPADLATYSQQVNIPVTPVTAAHTVGPNDPNSDQLEAALDIQMITTVDSASTPWFWLEDGNNWLYSFTEHFLQTKTVPMVVSISYAWSEMDQCEINPSECNGISSEQYVARVNADWQKIGLKGTSVLVASGDSGTNGRTDPDCELAYMKPDFPSCSPYVTSVGATQLENVPGPLSNPPPICQGSYQCAASGDEVAVSFAQSWFASGGGFSWYSPRPTYQASDVEGYFNSGVQLPPPSYYNTTNRGFPDVAAIGSACFIYDGGALPVGGTSCSAPIFGGVMGLLNNALIATGQSQLGFLNPFLYQMHSECPTCFQDIVTGDNTCTEDGCISSCKGFYCTQGWDPVTGLGTPNAQAMLNYVQQTLLQN